MRTRLLLVALAILVLAGGPAGQPVFTGLEIFPPEEFAARRTRVMDRIGDAVAVLQGTSERPGEQPLRQANQFFYLTGVVEPRALLVIDGHAKRSTLFLLPKNDRRERSMFGVGLGPGPDAARATGIESVLARDAFAAAIAEVGQDGRRIVTPFRPEVLGEASSSDPAALWRATANDPWDGRMSREQAFIAKLKAAAPRSEMTDLDPILDAMRVVKSPREIAVLRQSGRIAGLGVIEAMREASPGLYEYELQAAADFVFKKHGAYGPSYFGLIATGPNTYYSHYHKGTARLAEGDLVQMDYGADYKYYQSDITRVFPANGRFTPRQREYYSICLELYRAMMTSIRVHAAPAAILRDAVVKMDRILSTFAFADPKIKAAAVDYVERFRKSSATSLGHAIGMEVHDVGGPAQFATLEPGQLFCIEPAMRLEDEHLGIRIEDTILMTETGYESLTGFVPIEIADIEKTMKKTGPGKGKSLPE
ncbi:MAG TPA: Xaa-Pro peptidase family protein [Vicinamibacterales bacterium]|jgi:Xaa-Pro aminopeptidase